jgi:hypothetical protein
MLSFGQLFGSNFWSSFKSQPSESIEKLLKEENCPIESLLDDGDLLQECKNSNKNLINYLDREKVKQLIDLITVMPEEDEHDRGHKHPFLASELFNCDINEITEMFFIAPCDDKQPELEEEEEDATKFESNYEKDHDESNTDSDEANSNEGEDAEDAEGHKLDSADQKVDDDLKVEEMDTPDQQVADNNQDADQPSTDNTEAQNQDGDEAQPEAEAKDAESATEVIDVEDDASEKSLETPEETKTSEDAKSDEKVEETQPETTTPAKEESGDAPEETLKDQETKVAAETTVEASEPEKTQPAEEAKVEESEEEAQTTPEADTKPEPKQAFAETDPEKTTEGQQNDSESDLLTQVSEAASEQTVDTKAKEDLSDNKNDLLDYLNSFIQSDNELNDVLSGYYARLLNVLFQKKADDIGKYFYENEEHLYRLAYHSYSKSITDTVIKILDIGADRLGKEEAEVDRIRTQFIKKLLERLSAKDSEVAFEYSLNIFQVFNELSYKKAYYPLLVEQSILNTLGDILTNGSPEVSSNAAVRIFNILVTNIHTLKDSNQQKQTSFKWGNDDEDDVLIQEDESEKTEEKDDLIKDHHLTQYVRESVVDYLVEQLEIPPTKSIIDFQYGDNKFVLGKKRLACINLMESFIELNDPALKEKILGTKFYELLLHLFLEFPLNTFLQLHFDNIFTLLIKDESMEMAAKLKVLTDIHMFESIPSYWQDNQFFTFPSQREFRHGYLSFTTKLANLLTETAKTSPELTELLSTEEMKEFYEKDVAVYNEKNSIVLASRNRQDSNEMVNSDDDDVRFDNLDERDDIEDDEDDDYAKSRNSMRETLQAYDPNRATNDNENEYVNENVEIDKNEDQLFSGIGRYQGDNDSSDEDTPIGGDSDDDEQVSENSNYYDSNYWQVDHYSIDDLLQN